MGRWKPPPPKSSAYITAEGYRHMEQELSGLWERRKDVTKAITAAAAEGDRSENAEYIYRKKELREIDRRIGYLQRRMPKLAVVTEVGDPHRIFFGARITLEDTAGMESSYRIVGPDEIHEREEYISIDSVMARAVLGKCLDDEVIIDTVNGKQSYFVTGITYTENK